MKQLSCGKVHQAIFRKQHGDDSAIPQNPDDATTGHLLAATRCTLQMSPGQRVNIPNRNNGIRDGDGREPTMRGPDVRLALLQVIITVGIARELAAAAIKALAKLGPKARAAVPALLRSAANDEPSIRSLAVGALAAIDDRTVIPSLQGLLEDKDQFVREAARESLEKLSDAEE
jgi:hypothetical protein